MPSTAKVLSRAPPPRVPSAAKLVAVSTACHRPRSHHAGEVKWPTVIGPIVAIGFEESRLAHSYPLSIIHGENVVIFPRSLN